MKNNRALRWMYLKTGIACALVALVVGLRVDLDWASSFAAGSLLGLVNWLLLGLILLAVIGKRGGLALTLTGVKLGVLASLLVVVPVFRGQIAAFLCGFSMLLVMAVLESFGALLVAYLQKHPGSRPLPRDWRALILGSSSDV